MGSLDKSREKGYRSVMVCSIQLILRSWLVVGALVALTPCGICHNSQAAKTCSMRSMSGKMDCCHKNKPVSPLCKIMDQSTTVVSAKVLDPAPAVVVSVAVAPVIAPAGMSIPSAVVPDTSPHRAPLSLRI